MQRCNVSSSTSCMSARSAVDQPHKEILAAQLRHWPAGGEDGKQAYVSPVHAKDLSGLPPALIFTAGKDMLMDEAETYAAKLADAG